MFKHDRRVWIIMDELESLNALPQLHSALTQLREFDTPVVLGFQNMSQVEHLYGDKMAETILAQADTNIVLRTGHPGSAKHLSDLIGEQELERVRENRPAPVFMRMSGRSLYSERVMVPVVLPSEIQGLDDLTGYLVTRSMVVPLSFNVIPKVKKCDGIIDRIIQPVAIETSAEEAWRGEVYDS
jgi:type IV secretory pathway TraG/TraD family ATPase VirD4